MSNLLLRQTKWLVKNLFYDLIRAPALAV